MKKQNTNNIIALDGDGVLFHYNKGVANLFTEITKLNPIEINSKAYNAHKQFNFDNEVFPDFKKAIYPLFNKYKYWGKLPIYDNVKESLDLLVSKGYKLVCLTSMPPKYKELRMQNIQKHNLPIDDVIAVDRLACRKLNIQNPKLDFIEKVKPIAFVDDLLKNFIDMEHITDTQLVWLDNQHCVSDNPNLNYDDIFHQKIHSLMDFAQSMPDISTNYSFNKKFKFN